MRDLQRTQRRHIMASRQHVGYSLGMQGRTARASALMGIFRECPIVTSYILRTHEPCVPTGQVNFPYGSLLPTTYYLLLTTSFPPAWHQCKLVPISGSKKYEKIRVYTWRQMQTDLAIEGMLEWRLRRTRAVRPYRSSEFPAWFTTTYYLLPTTYDFVPLRKLVY